MEMKNEDIPPFQLRCINDKGEEEVVLPKIMKIYNDQGGDYIEYQPMKGITKYIELKRMKEINYIPDYLRAAYCHIQDSTTEMKKLKKMIEDELVKSEEKILKFFLTHNKEFRRILNL